MKELYIFDLLGIHCGMHYYTNAFYDLLSDNASVKTRLLVNYEYKDQKPFFKNVFTKNKIKACFLLACCFFKLFSLVLFKQRSYLIILSFGQRIDLILFICALLNRNVIIDIHEVYAKEKSKRSFHVKVILWYYARIIKNVISHSEKTSRIIRHINRRINIFFVPHFKYNYNKTIVPESLEDEVKNIYQEDKINILYFGNITRAKGVDILVDAILSLPEKSKSNLNICFTGRERDYTFPDEILSDDCCRFIRRKISDNESNYLYSKCDYVILPYRTSYQSGVLEAALYFKKPVIISDIFYFKKFINSYPSFGEICEPDSRAIAVLLNSIPLLHKTKRYYSENDLSKLNSFESYISFRNELTEFILNK